MTKKPKPVDLTSLPPLRVTISKTADGSRDYMQITSNDEFALNIVLISCSIEVNDSRKPKMESDDDE